LDGHRTMEAKYVREDQERFGTTESEGSGSKKEKDRKVDSDPFKTRSEEASRGCWRWSWPRWRPKGGPGR